MVIQSTNCEPINSMYNTVKSHKRGPNCRLSGHPPSLICLDFLLRSKSCLPQHKHCKFQLSNRCRETGLHTLQSTNYIVAQWFTPYIVMSQASAHSRVSAQVFVLAAWMESAHSGKRPDWILPAYGELVIISLLFAPSDTFLTPFLTV